MANINVNDLLNLNLSGVDLFNDSESFLTEITDESEQINVHGGRGCHKPSCVEVSAVCIRNTGIYVDMAV